MELSERVTRRGVQPESTDMENLALTSGFILKVLVFVMLHPEREVALTVTVFGYGAAVSFSYILLMVSVVRVNKVSPFPKSQR